MSSPSSSSSPPSACSFPPPQTVPPPHLAGSPCLNAFIPSALARTTSSSLKKVAPPRPSSCSPSSPSNSLTSSLRSTPSPPSSPSPANRFSPTHPTSWPSWDCARSTSCSSACSPGCAFSTMAWPWSSPSPPSRCSPHTGSRSALSCRSPSFSPSWQSQSAPPFGRHATERVDSCASGNALPSMVGKLFPRNSPELTPVWQRRSPSRQANFQPIPRNALNPCTCPNCAIGCTLALPLLCIGHTTRFVARTRTMLFQGDTHVSSLRRAGFVLCYYPRHFALQ